MKPVSGNEEKNEEEENEKTNWAAPALGAAA
jgi:hypothetical protein